MKYLNRLKSEKGLLGELPKLPKPPFDTFGSSKGRRFLENIPLSYPGCFSPDGLLEEITERAQTEGWTEDQLLTCIGTLAGLKVLQAPWGFLLKVKDRPYAGDYWIISGPEARGRVPQEARSFTLDELRPQEEGNKA